MFCSKCGNTLANDSDFCSKCGMQIMPTNSEPNSSLTDSMPQTDSMQLIITIGKAMAAGLSNLIFHVFIDGAKVGEILNGETASYKISPGEHIIKIGACSIGIRVPSIGNPPVVLLLKWGLDIKPEIVCHQQQIVTQPSVVDKVKATTQTKLGYFFAGFGIIGFVVGLLIFQTLEGTGSIVTPGQHSANLNILDFALPFVIGGLALVIFGAVLIILSSLKPRK